MAEETFDNLINADLHSAEMDTRMNLARTVVGGGIGIVTDAAASMWNSLPGTPEVETADLLRRINADALQVYNENPDTIQLGSLIAGSIIPAGLATKGMNAMRGGMKGVNWFTKAGKEADMLKVDNLFREAGGATSEYKSALKQMYGKGFANQALDAVAAETAVLGTLNAHPLMEDYFQDPVKNFSLSIGLGGVLGGAIGHIADRYAVRSLTGGITKDAIDSTIGKLRTISPDMTSGVALQSHEVNIQNLGNILSVGKEAGKTADNDLAMAIAERTLLSERNKQAVLFEEIIGPNMKNTLSKEEKDSFMQSIVQQPEMFGVEKVDFFRPQKVSKDSFKTPKDILQEKPALTKDVLDPVTGAVETKEIKSVFYPEFGKFGTEADIVNYGNAAALGKNATELQASLPKSFGKVPNLDSSLELATKSAAEVHGEYVATKLRIDKMDTATMEKVIVGQDDIPMLSALVTKAKEDPTIFANLKVQVADRSPVYKAIMNEAGAAGGLDSKAVNQFAQKSQAIQQNMNIFDPIKDMSLSSDVKGLVNDWIGGMQAGLNKIALAGSAKGFSAYGVDTKAKALFDELYNSSGSKALRTQLAQIADADGNVLLYRGSKASTIRQQNILESYSLDPTKAAEFGKVRMYKVHVDNIVAGWNDIPNKAGIAKNELVVLPQAATPEAVIEGGKINFNRQLQAGQIKIEADGVKSLNGSELEQLLASKKQELIDSMLTAGHPLESISIKADIPMETLEDYVMNANKSDLLDMYDGSSSLIKTSSSTVANEALDKKKIPLVLEGNIKKNPYTEAHAALDNKTMKDMNDTLSMSVMYSSQSSTARELGKYLYEDLKLPLDILKQQLGAANNEFAGTKLFNSTDFWARNMGSVGPIATAIGRQVQRIANDTIKRVVTPVSDAMSVVAKSATATVEFNTFVNVNASLKGWRQFTAEGKLMQKVERMGDDGVAKIVLEPVKYEGKDYIVQTPEVRKLILGMQDQGKELLNLTNTYKKLLGAPDVNDIGLWIPSFNPVGKFIAYVHDAATDTTKLLYANNKEQFADTVKSYKKYLTENGLADKIKVFTKDEQAEYNILNGRLDTVNMERADTGMQKTGSAASANVKNDLNVFSEIAGGYEHYITSQVRNLTDVNMSDVTGMLDRMSTINQAISNNQPLGKIKEMLNQPKDAARTLKNTLLGNSNLGEYAGWQSINQGFETGLGFGLKAVSNIWDNVTKPVRSIFGKNAALTPEQAAKVDYKVMSEELAKQGIVNPWAKFDEEAAKMYGLSRIEDSKDTSKRIIYASNALAATVALRIGELAQPIVNILSLPVLTGLATASKMPAEFMGVARGTANVGGVQIMYEGARAANSPIWRALDAKWAKEGYYSPLVSEASNVMRLSRSFEKGAISKIENALDSNMVNIMSKPADWSESFVRRQTMFTGAVLAKRLYPELSDEGITIFARDFMDKAVGNFHASQRPVFFQGTLGVALGLFQTYMLTLGQSVYRQLEMKNYKALGKAALTQSGIFGVSSMPGFQQVSQMIGDNFSDDNVDLTTGAYRALGSKTADFLLYGLPSNLGPSFHTRGDVSIRPPNVLAGAQNTVAVSFASQTLDMFGQLQKAVGSDAPDMARAIGQALSMQSMSRPLARTAELATGYSVTQKGNTVQTPEEVWTATGIFSRVLGTRPLEESKLREAMHLNTFYGSKDREARQEITKKLKTAIRGGELSTEQIEKFSSDYLRKGGTPTGWRAAMNEAAARSNANGEVALLEKLKPNNPLNFMINNLD